MQQMSILKNSTNHIFRKRVGMAEGGVAGGSIGWSGLGAPVRWIFWAAGVLIRMVFRFVAS